MKNEVRDLHSNQFLEPTESFKTNYIQSLVDTVAYHKEEINKHPTKEIELLKVMKLFTDESNQKNIDQMIDYMVLYKTLHQMSEEVSSYEEDSSIHNDGIYEIDYQCMEQKSKIKKTNKIDRLFMAIILANGWK